MKPELSDKLQALFLDVDGVVLDTELFQYLATQQAFLRHGVIPSEEAFTEAFYSEKCAGAHWKKYLEEVAPDKVFSSEQLDVIETDRTKLLKGLLQTHEIRLLLGAEDMIKYALERFGYDKFAFTTGATREESLSKLDKSGLDSGILNALHSGKIKLVGIEQANGKAKPHPDIYLAAKDLVGVNPAYAVTMEDTVAGCQSAYEARIGTIIAVPNALTNLGNFDQYATARVSNLTEAKNLIVRL